MTSAESIVVRPCRAGDLPAVAALAARLAREHHTADPRRFMISDRVQEGYAAFLKGELRNRDAVVLVAVDGDSVLGYGYGRIEPRDWYALRDRCGVLHDVYVDEQVRRAGLATRLVEDVAAALARLGAPRIVLMTASGNVAARRLFQRLGFRETMIEMTREIPDADPGSWP